MQTKTESMFPLAIREINFISNENAFEHHILQEDDPMPSNECDVMNVIQNEESEGEENLEEDVDTESDTDFKEFKRRTFNPCRNFKSYTLCLYMVLTFVLLSSIVAVVVIGVLIVLPYRKAIGFVESSCIVVHSKVDATEELCSCGQGCSSAYDCLKITVVCLSINTNSTEDVMLYENEATLGRKVSYCIF